MRVFEVADDLVFGEPELEIVVQLFALDFVFLVIPLQLFQVQIHEILQVLSLCVDSTEDEHVLSHQNSSVAAPALDRLLVVHLQIAGRPTVQIDEVDRIVADSAFSADIVGAHPSEDDNEPVFVEDGGVIASGCWHLELLRPGLSIQRVDLSSGKGIAAVAADNDDHAVEDSGGVAFPGFWLPPFQFIIESGHGVLDILGCSFHC